MWPVPPPRRDEMGVAPQPSPKGGNLVYVERVKPWPDPNPIAGPAMQHVRCLYCETRQLYENGRCRECGASLDIR